MKILLLTDSYPPEIRSISILMYDFVKELKTRGYKISVITTKPRYNLAKEQSNIKYNLITEEDSGKVVRIDIPFLHKANFLIRGLATLISPFLFYRTIKRIIKKRIIEKPDIVMVYSPPLTLGMAGLWVKKRFSSKFILNVQDIFPQNAVDLGVLKSPLIIKFFEWLEKWIYKKADIITVHSEGNKKFLLERKRQSDCKVKVVPNWANISRFKNISKRINFRHKFGLDSKFIIVFAGVLGPSQGLDVIIDVAKELQENSDIHFLFIGDGTEKLKLEGKALSFGLANISFRSFISEEDYPELLKEVDVGLVCLSSKNKTPVVPGKLMGYMAVGLPILAILNKESDGHNIIKSAGCGFNLLPEDRRVIINSILELKGNQKLREQFGNAGKIFAQNNFSKEVCLDKYEDIFRQLLKE